MIPLRSPLHFLSLALATCPALAQDLFVGSRTTEVTQNDFLDGSSTLIGVCGGQVQSMTVLNDEIFIGDLNGNIYHYDPSTGVFTYFFTSVNDAQALAAHAGDLLIGGSDNSILRYDLTGTLQATLNANVPVTAMLLEGSELIVASVSGLIQSGDPVTGNFQFWATCGNNVNSLASNGVDLFASDAGQVIWRFDLATQSLIQQGALASEGLALGILEGDLLVGCENGDLLRMQTTPNFFGAIKSNDNAGFPVDAFAIVDVPEPGQRYCLGTACPCGNDDLDNGCGNSNGYGTGLVARGSTSVTADDLEVVIYDIPQNKPGRFYMGQVQNSLPFGDGMLCVGAGGYPIFRLQVDFSGADGVLRMGPGLVSYVQNNLGAAAQIQPGSTWHFQAWYRDKFGPCGSAFNTSSAYTVSFTP